LPFRGKKVLGVEMAPPSRAMGVRTRRRIGGNAMTRAKGEREVGYPHGCGVSSVIERKKNIVRKDWEKGVNEGKTMPRQGKSTGLVRGGTGRKQI